MKIVVIGGCGRVGGNVVRRLLTQGHDRVPASPATGVDTGPEEAYDNEAEFWCTNELWGRGVIRRRRGNACLSTR